MLSARDLGKSYGRVQALAGLSLSVAAGEIVSVTGPSGAGKSTLGRLVSGLVATPAGSISLGGHDVSRLPPQARRVAHMFESFALYPTRSVAQNVASPLEAPASAGRWTAQQRAQRIDEVLALTEMSALRDRLPSQLSGGQKQRVALCRALVQAPSVYVLDEPIGHLDAKLRHTLRGEIRRRQARADTGTLWLTPDGIEAMAVADRMLVLMDGQVQQLGTPSEVFARPANVRVARLIGDPAMNVLAATLQPGSPPRLVVGSTVLPPPSDSLLARLAPHARGGRLQLGLRPTEMRVGPPDVLRPAGGTDVWPAMVYAVELLGQLTIFTLDIGGQRLRVKQPSADGAWAMGASVAVALRGAQLLCFDPDTGALVS